MEEPLLLPNPPRRSHEFNIINTENVLCFIFYVLLAFLLWFVMKNTFMPKPPVVEISHLTSLVGRAKLHIHYPTSVPNASRGWSIPGRVFHENKCVSAVKLLEYLRVGDRDEEIVVGFEVDSDKLPRSDYELSLFDLVVGMYTEPEGGGLWDRFLMVDCKDMVLPNPMPGRMRCSAEAYRVFKYCDWCYKSIRWIQRFMVARKPDFRKPCPLK